MTDLISVVVLNYNGKQYLESCFNSLKKQTYSPLELILVDNSSTDGSVELVKKYFPEVKIICNGTNAGFAAGNNFGVLQARSKYVALLNNDTIVNEKWAETLMQEIRNSDVAVVGSKVYTEGINPEFYRKNGTINLIGYNIYNIFENPADTFIASGCSLIFDREKIGLPFDPDYFFYSEDIHLSWLARLKGYRVLQSSESVVYHFGSGTARKQKASFRTFYQERNRLLNLFIFYELSILLRVIPFIVFDLFVKPIYVIFNPKKSLLGWFKAMAWFFINFPTIFHKRIRIQKQRVSPDTEILKYMSCKIVNARNIFGKIINQLSWFYCNTVRIKTVEANFSKKSL